LTQCAWGATRKKDGYLKAKYYSMIKHKGKKKALVAIAHKILVACYFVLKRQEAYKEPTVKAINQEKEIKKYLKKLAELGVGIPAA
jgi:transposase